MSDTSNLFSGMPDIDYGQFSQYLQDTAHYRMMERLDKLNTTPPYLDAIQEHNERVEEARQANISMVDGYYFRIVRDSVG